MKSTKRSRFEQVNLNLQKTISNLISNVISSLCQQFIRYEHSVDIFGILSINIDEDIDINVKVNEKFSKRESLNNVLDFDCSKIIETIKKNVIENQNISEENEFNQMDTEEIINEEVFNNESNEKDGLKPVRKPRKQQQTFRHIVEDMDQSKDPSKTHSFIRNIDFKDLTVDTERESENSKINNIDQYESVIQTNGITEPEMIPFNVIIQNGIIDENQIIDEKDTNDNDPKLKCPICDRQFKRKFFLARHKRAHQNVKAYSCNMCGISFELSNQLKRHLRNSHMNNRDSLRRSCAKYSNAEDNLDQNSESMTSSNNVLTIPSTSATISTNSHQTLSKSNSFIPFSYPPGLIASQSGKKQVGNAFIPPTSITNHYQVHQLFNPMVNRCSDPNFHYNNSMYYVQNYPQILPAISQGIYSPTMTKSKVTASTINPGISHCNVQRLPIYPFSQNILSSPSLKNIPVTNNNSLTTEPIVTLEKSAVPKGEMS